MASTTCFQSPSSASFLRSKSNSVTQSPPSSVSFRRSSAVRAAANTTTATAPSSSSLYEVLGVQDGATRREIREAYRKLARVLHPDVAAGDKDATSAAGDFIRLHEAYATLSDPRKKFEYDRMILLKRHRIAYSQATSAAKTGTSSYSGFAGYTRRSWETDQCW